MVRNGFSLAFVHVLGAEPSVGATYLPEQITPLVSVLNATEQTAEKCLIKVTRRRCRRELVLSEVTLEGRQDTLQRKTAAALETTFGVEQL